MADRGIVETTVAGRQDAQSVRSRDLTATTDEGSFVGQYGAGRAPAAVDFAHHLVGWDAYFGQEDFVEVRRTIGLHERTDLNAWRVHVGQQEGEAPMFGGFGIGTGQQEAPVSELGA